MFSKDECHARKKGEIYFVDEDYLLINCGDGLINIKDIRDKDYNKIEQHNIFKQKDIFT